MKTLIDVAENATVDLSIARTVLGEAMEYFEDVREESLAELPHYAEQIYHLLIVVDRYVGSYANDLQEAVEQTFKNMREMRGKANGQAD